MISKPVLSEIERRVETICSSFGDATDLVLAMSRSVGVDPPSLSDRETEYEVGKLLYHPDLIASISPWSYRFPIVEYSEYGTVTDSSVILDEPYNVFTTGGKLLYSVSSHQGVFGNSILDKSLILESPSGKTYYLQFPTYLGHTRTIQLIVNRISIRPPISLPQFKPKPTITESNLRNSIYLRASSAYRNSSVVGNPVYPVTLHILRTNTVVRPTTAQVIANGETIDYPLDLDENVIFHPQESGWIVLTQDTDLGLRMLNIGNVNGQGTSRLLEVSPFLYFMAASPNEDLNMVRQNLGLLTQLLPSPSNQGIS